MIGPINTETLNAIWTLIIYTEVERAMDNSQPGSSFLYGLGSQILTLSFLSSILTTYTANQISAVRN